MTTQLQKAHVLVVDDEKINRKLLESILHEHYRVSLASSGAEAFTLMKDELPDLMLLDVMMPDMDGFELCERMQAYAHTRAIPVIMVTAADDTVNESRAFQLGAVDFISKPIRGTRVLARIQNHLMLKQSRERHEELAHKLSRYLPPQVYANIFEGTRDVSVSASRKKLTVFFSDIVGFTRRTERMENEDLTYLLNGYLQRMSEIVHKHGGTLDKFIGDAMLVFFGDPHTSGSEEDARACVRMALDMKRALRELRSEWTARGIDSDLHVRMGISTGFCTVGNFGSDQRMDYTVVGTQVNLASRLESAANPDAILLSRDTWMLVKDEFECMRRDPVTAKGIADPIECFEVLGSLGACDLQHVIEELPGFMLRMEPHIVSSEDIPIIKQSLELALQTLSQHESGSQEFCHRT